MYVTIIMIKVLLKGSLPLRNKRFLYFSHQTNLTEGTDMKSMKHINIFTTTLSDIISYTVKNKSEFDLLNRNEMGDTLFFDG